MVALATSGPLITFLQSASSRSVLHFCFSVYRGNSGVLLPPSANSHWQMESFRDIISFQTNRKKSISQNRRNKTMRCFLRSSITKGLVSLKFVFLNERENYRPQHCAACRQYGEIKEMYCVDSKLKPFFS